MGGTSLTRREFLALSAGVIVAPPAVLPPVSWTCPMHPEVVDGQSGKCPICKMQLTPIRLDVVWSCQLHLDAITERQPGRCRICGRQLVKIIKALSFSCPIVFTSAHAARRAPRHDRGQGALRRRAAGISVRLPVLRLLERAEV